MMLSPGVDPPEAATDGDDDEGHEGNDHRAEVDIGVRKVRLLRNVLRLSRVDVPGLEVLSENNCFPVFLKDSFTLL